MVVNCSPATVGLIAVAEQVPTLIMAKTCCPTCGGAGRGGPLVECWQRHRGQDPMQGGGDEGGGVRGRWRGQFGGRACARGRGEGRGRRGRHQGFKLCHGNFLPIVRDVTHLRHKIESEECAQQ